MGEVNTVPMRINGVEGAAGQVKVSGGPGVLETWVGMAAGTPTTIGNYPGNNTVNRVIPHGLGVTPTIVIIVQRANDNNIKLYHIHPSLNYIIATYSNLRGYAVTGLDNTNFYVGNAASYTATANATGDTYYWTAIG